MSGRRPNAKKPQKTGYGSDDDGDNQSGSGSDSDNDKSGSDYSGSERGQKKTKDSGNGKFPSQEGKQYDSQTTSEMLNYKKAVFEIKHHDDTSYRKTYFLSDPRKQCHLCTSRPSFAYPYANKQQSLDFAIKKPEKGEVSQLQEMLIKNYGGDNVNSDETVVRPAMILMELSIMGVNSSSPAVPIGLSLSGLSEGYVNPCSASWTPTNPPLAVLHHGFAPLSVSKLNLDTEPFFYSILGGNAASKTDHNYTTWGGKKNDKMELFINSGKFVWLMYNIPVYLVDYYAINNNNQYITADLVAAMKEFVKKNPMPEIYSATANLEDNYMGRVADVLANKTPHKDLKCWNISSFLNEMYTVPYDFFKWCVDTHYVQAMKKIRAIQDSVVMHLIPAPMSNAYTSNDNYSFQVEMNIYHPKLVTLREDIKDSKKDKLRK
jgi:hypothetical protein